ncbi:MAG: hypothetical protein AAF219_02600 [Myxococcota bacterium]
MTGMSHLVIGDGHFRGGEDEMHRWSRLLDRAHADGMEELSILGDLFELWLALDDVMPRWQHAILEPLHRLRGQGVRLRYAVGNKDYFVEAWNETAKLFHSVIVDPMSLNSPHGPLYLSHGDLVNDEDTQYRAWHSFSRSLPARIVARALPASWLRGVGDRLAKQLEGTNRTHKMYFPERALEARAKELPPGPATQIYGHFHVYRELHFGEKRVITLPFLSTENAGVWIDQKGIRRYPDA